LYAIGTYSRFGGKSDSPARDQDAAWDSTVRGAIRLPQPGAANAWPHCAFLLS